MQMPFKERIKRLFGFGDYGLYRSSNRANELHTSQIGYRPTKGFFFQQYLN